MSDLPVRLYDLPPRRTVPGIDVRPALPPLTMSRSALIAGVLLIQRG